MQTRTGVVKGSASGSVVLQVTSWQENSEWLKSENSHFLWGVEQEQQLVLKCVKLIYRDTEKEYENVKKKSGERKSKERKGACHSLILAFGFC